jgi:ABC-2 type transport system ATP-binding protein
VIALRGLVKDYPVVRDLGEILRSPLADPRHRVLHGVDLDVAPGEIRVLLGPNGSGKTTCLAIIAGLVRANGGSVQVCGRDVEADLGTRALVGLVTGDRGFYGRLSVRENLRFFAALHGIEAADARIEALGARLGFGEYLAKPFRFLSTGQRARVALGRGLLHQPRVLLLDEVTRSLDPRSTAAVRAHVQELAATGIAVLFTTHDLVEAAQLATRVALLDHGKVVADGSWDQVRPAVDAAFAAEDDL